MPNYANVLNDELRRRVKSNPRYSLRAFAKMLAIPVSTLSRALAGKRPLPLAAAVKAADALKLTPKERAAFFESIANRGAAGPDVAGGPHTLADEVFRTIADWQHYAILELTFLAEFSAEPRWLAAKLGIAPVAAELAVGRLIKLGLLVKKDGRYSKAQRTLWTGRHDGRSSPAIRKHHKQCLAMAAKALEEISASERTSTAMTIPIDAAKLPIAKKMIEEFAQELCKTLATAPMTDVFQLTIGFHSILKGTKRYEN